MVMNAPLLGFQILPALVLTALSPSITALPVCSLERQKQSCDCSSEDILNSLWKKKLKGFDIKSLVKSQTFSLNGAFPVFAASSKD